MLPFCAKNLFRRVGQLEERVRQVGAGHGHVRRIRGVDRAEGAVDYVAEQVLVQFCCQVLVRGDNSDTGERVVLDGKALCSMNMWGFTPDYFAGSAAIFEDFLEKNIGELKKEYYIPYAVDCLVKSGQARTDVLTTPSRWFGVTYKEDRPAVVAKFKELADTGVYPSPLYK